MAQYNMTMLTTAGNALLTKALQGATIAFTKFYLTSTECSDAMILQMTKADLVSHGINQQGEITHIYRDGAIVQIETLVDNEELAAGYDINSVFLGATDPDDGEIIFAGCSAAVADYMPADSGGSKNSVIFKFMVTISREANVTMTVSSAAVATQADIQDLSRSIKAFLGGVADAVELGVDGTYGNKYINWEADGTIHNLSIDDNTYLVYQTTTDNWQTSTEVFRVDMKHATASNFGVVKLSDSYTATGTAANGLVPSQKALNDGLKQLLMVGPFYKAVTMQSTDTSFNVDIALNTPDGYGAIGVVELRTTNNVALGGYELTNLGTAPKVVVGIINTSAKTSTIITGVVLYMKNL